MKTIRIGSGAGYAGDRLEPSLELIEKGNLDYISYECLAERTIAIGQQAKLKDPTKGYNGLLEHRMEKALPLAWKHKVKVITNMGSANPQAAAKVCVEIARRHGLQGMKIACVTGDDLLPVIDKYMDTEVWETHKPLRELPGEIVSANAYMGVEGILKALDLGADVVITGRVSDPAIFMAPLIHEFGWSLEDWDKLGKGTMVGHLLECGGQVTGGYFAEPGKKDVPGVFDELKFDLIGCNSLYWNPDYRYNEEPSEVRVRVAGRAKTKAEADLIGNEVEALYTNGPAGGCGAVKRTRDIVSVASILVSRYDVKPEAEIFEV